MKTFYKNSLILALAAYFMILTACNKDVEQFPLPEVPPPTGQTLGEQLAATATDSLFNRLVINSGLSGVLNNRSGNYTLFVPDNNAVIASFGGSLASANGTIAALPQQVAASIVAYNILPQRFTSAAIPESFPNLQLPTALIADPTNPLVRLTTAVSKRGAMAFNNNIPLTAVDQQAANGVMHRTALIVAPPSQFLWERINTDDDLSILKAAIQRADSGSTAATSIQAILNMFGPNFTLFAPTNQAFKNVISFLSGGALQPDDPDAFFIGFLGTDNVTTEMVRGIVVYHVFDGQASRPGRAFTPNFPTTATSYPTLLNSAISAHPGVTVSVTFNGPAVIAGTVRGLGNPSASNLIINPTPAPSGSSDQHYINGVLHKIDQVLLPQ